MRKKPNIFDYATSELSQDAFLCWLIAYSDETYKANDPTLNQIAHDFVIRVIGESNEYKISKVEVGRQWNNIDVGAIINNEYFIAVEDKKGTKEHSDQLRRYSKIANEHYSNSNKKIILVYFKMEEQGQYTDIEKAGFLLFDRRKMIEVLNPLAHKKEPVNTILNDYYNYVIDLDKKINSYKDLNIKDWHWYSWIGFYSYIQRFLEDGTWDYVANPAGGFLGFWWYWYSFGDSDNFSKYYLQIEQDKLVFKLSCSKKELRNQHRDIYRNILFKKAQEIGIEISKFGRIGQYMGVAKYCNEYRITDSNGIIDLNETCELLKKCQTLLDVVNEELSGNG